MVALIETVGVVVALTLPENRTRGLARRIIWVVRNGGEGEGVRTFDKITGYDFTEGVIAITFGISRRDSAKAWSSHYQGTVRKIYLAAREWCEERADTLARCRLRMEEIAIMDLSRVSVDRARELGEEYRECSREAGQVRQSLQNGFDWVEGGGE